MPEIRLIVAASGHAGEDIAVPPKARVISITRY